MTPEQARAQFKEQSEEIKANIEAVIELANSYDRPDVVSVLEKVCCCVCNGNSMGELELKLCGE